MKTNEKQRVLDTLRDAGLATNFFNPLRLNLEGSNLWRVTDIKKVGKDLYAEKHEKLEPSVNEIIPDNISDIILNYLDTMRPNYRAWYKIFSPHGSFLVVLGENGEDDAKTRKQFKWNDDTPRAVAYAQGLVWVWKNLMEN